MNGYESRFNRCAQRRKYLTGLIAVISCPCHLPILLVLLSGTAAGAYLEANTAMAVTWMVPLFFASALATWHLLGGNSHPGRGGSSAAACGDDARQPSACAAEALSRSTQEK